MTEGRDRQWKGRVTELENEIEIRKGGGIERGRWRERERERERENERSPEVKQHTTIERVKNEFNSKCRRGLCQDKSARGWGRLIYKRQESFEMGGRGGVGDDCGRMQQMAHPSSEEAEEALRTGREPSSYSSGRARVANTHSDWIGTNRTLPVPHAGCQLLWKLALPMALSLAPGL